MAAAAARAALNTAVEKHGIDPGTPEEQGAALAQRGLWAETWDQGDSWHYSGDPEEPLSPEEAVVECAAMEANEAENYADFGTSKPDSEAAAQASFNRAVTIEWVVGWTTKHNLWEWTTADVVSKKIKPVTRAPRLEPWRCSASSPTAAATRTHGSLRQRLTRVPSAAADDNRDALSIRRSARGAGDGRRSSST